MLKTRVIPVLLWDGVRCVRPKYFEKPGRNVGSMIQYVQNFNNRNIDEIIILNIAAREQGFSIRDYEARIMELTEKLYCPCTFGGNVNTLEDIELLLKYGADKVTINTATKNLAFVEDAAKKFGSQAIVASIDSKRSWTNNPYRKTITDRCLHIAYVNGGKECLNIQAREHARRLEDAGVGEILLTSMEKDGTRAGYDKSLVYDVSMAVKIPVIANGGCAGFADMADVLRKGAHAVAASSMFLFTPLTPANCSLYLENNGFPTRVENK